MFWRRMIRQESRILLIKRLLIPLLVICALTIQFTACRAVAYSCVKSAHLFHIERNKNGNVVYYDVCLNNNGDIAASNPALAYWVLENGKREELGLVDRTFAYGILFQGKAVNGGESFSIAALKKIHFRIETISKEYKAVASINNRDMIIERIYVNSKEHYLGLPKVVYVDIYGWTREGNIPVKERLLPE